MWPKDWGGHSVTCDSFFTSPDVGQHLLKRKITMVDTVQKNKPELPPPLLTQGERGPLIKVWLHPNTTLVSYIPKKNQNVVLLSKPHKAADISDRTASATVVKDVQVAGPTIAPAAASAETSNRKRCCVHQRRMVNAYCVVQMWEIHVHCPCTHSCLVPYCMCSLISEVLRCVISDLLGSGLSHLLVLL